MKRHLLLLSMMISLVFSACGGAGGNASADRTVDVTMRDIAYTPTSIDVKQGETIRFHFTNTGKLVHDAFIGDAKEQNKHEASMRDESGDGHHMHGSDAITLEPGDDADLVHTFKKAGTYFVGCHEEGHYDAGMRITVNVS